jgi:hypothetical protein
MWQRLIEALERAITTNAQGMLLFVVGSLIMTLLHLIFNKQIVTGFKGDNGRWEPPEWMTYIVTWMLPEFLMADAWLGLRLSDAGYIILGELVLFALAGRLGLEYLMNMRGRTVNESKQTIEVTKKETTQETPDKVE